MKIEEFIKQKKFESEYQKLAINLFYTSRWLENLHEKTMKNFNLTFQQFNILRILRGQQSQPLSVNCLIERMVDKSSNASRLVDKLQEKGLVDRTVCPNDRRQVDVIITEKGLTLLSEMDGPIRNMSESMKNLSEKDAALVNELLDRMRGTE